MIDEDIHALQVRHFGANDLKLSLQCNVITMILAVNRQFFAKGPKITSDKSAFLYSILTLILQVTECNEKALGTTGLH